MGPINQWPARLHAQSAQQTAEPVQKGLNFASVGVATTAQPPMPTPPPAQVRAQLAICKKIRQRINNHCKYTSIKMCKLC